MSFDGAPDGDWVIGLEALERSGRDRLLVRPTAVDDAVAAIGPERLATLIYTSGTTGPPKEFGGPRQLDLRRLAIQALGLLWPDDSQYPWLPLSHSFGEVPLSAQLAIGFATAVDGRIPKLVDNLAVIRPTFMAGADLREGPALGHGAGRRRDQGRRIFDRSMTVGRRVAARRRAGWEPGGLSGWSTPSPTACNRCCATGSAAGCASVSGSAALSAEVASSSTPPACSSSRWPWPYRRPAS